MVTALLILYYKHNQKKKKEENQQGNDDCSHPFPPHVGFSPPSAVPNVEPTDCVAGEGAGGGGGM